MHVSKKTVSGFLLLTISLSSWSFAADAVTSSLTVSRIERQADGTENTLLANTAKPGDILQYVAEYKNHGKDAVMKLEATLPIPAGTEYLEGSSAPAPAAASLDGKTFEPLPLKRKVKQADGKIVEQLVPYPEYRSLRWAPQDLPAGKSLKYIARARVSKP